MRMNPGLAGAANVVGIGELADEIKEAVSYPLLDELPEYVPDDNAAGRMKLTVSQLKAMQADDDSEENAYMDESVKAALKRKQTMSRQTVKQWLNCQIQ